MITKTHTGKWYNYLLYKPEDSNNKDFPLLLFLHGAGERGNNLDKVKKHGPLKIIEQGAQLPFTVLAPQCPSNCYWETEKLFLLLEDIVKETNADRTRIYITGISMGGYGTWALLAEHPEMFAAAIPICGGGDPYLVHEMLKTPIWAFHGALDDVVPLSASSMMVEALRKAGGDINFTIYPEADHDSWTETYENPKIYEWLLSHKKS